MVFNECWCYYLHRGLRWLWKQPFILVGNPASVPSRFFFVLFYVEKSDNYSFFLIEVLSSRAFDQNFLHVLTFRSGIEAQFFLLTSLLFLWKSPFSFWIDDYCLRWFLLIRVDFGNASSSSFVWILIFRLKFP